MGLGNRSAKRHETEGTRKTAGVRAEDYWDYQPGQTVMTVDGFLGKVTAVEDGPFAGGEQYQVTLLNNMGGGIYTSSQLRASSTTTAAADHEAANTAARDYPELAEILEQRPDPGKYPSSTLGMIASLQTQAGENQPRSHHTWNNGICANCGSTTYSKAWNDPCEGWASHTDADLLEHNLVGPTKYSSLQTEAARNKGACDGCGLPMHYSRETGKITWHIPSKGVRGAAFKAAHDIDDAGVDSDDDLWHFDCPECGYSHSEYKDPEMAKHLSAKEAAYYTEADLREAAGAPGLCENGHLTWGGHCPSCRNADDSNSMVTNPGDHKPQDVEHTKNASYDPAYDDDEDGREEQMVSCPRCGQWKGQQSQYHPGNDGPCPNASESEDDIFDRLDPSKYCGEHCQSAHASDIAHGVMGHHTFKTNEPEYAEHGTGMANTTSPYDAPAERDSNYEVRDPDAAGLCHYCRKPLMGSVGDQIDQIGDPRSEHFLKSNPTGPTKYSSYQSDDGYCEDANCEQGHCAACGGHQHDDNGHHPFIPEDELDVKSNFLNDMLGQNPTGPTKYSSVHQAGMHGVPLHDVGDRVINFRGESGTVKYVQDSGHPGKSNKVGVEIDGTENPPEGHPDHVHWQDPGEKYVSHNYENVWEPHPEAPPEQHAKYHQRKADNKAATDLLSSIEAEHGDDFDWLNNQRLSAVQTVPVDQNQTHTRVVPEDDDWDQYLVTRCMDHGTKIVGDRASQEAYIGVARACHHAASTDSRGHVRHHQSEGTDCWSCCPDMYIAHPGEKESGRTASLKFGLAMIALAKSDPDLGFHITASWRDVRNKAKRIRTEGGVHITTAQNGYVIAQVKGDHGTYESVLMRVPGTQKVGQWDCGCKWATYHWGAPDDYSRFAGRMCSHALALNFEAQSRGMFGREVKTDQGVPRWLNQGDFDRTASLGLDLPFLSVFATLALAEGESPESVAQMLASVNSPFGEPGPSQVPTYPATMPKNPGENPASAGFLTASDPASWSQANTPDLADRVASMDDSLFEPGTGDSDSKGGMDQQVDAWSQQGSQGAEATLHDEPEAALPSTDGSSDDEDMFGPQVTSSASHQGARQYEDPRGFSGDCDNCGKRGVDLWPHPGCDEYHHCYDCSGVQGHPNNPQISNLHQGAVGTGMEYSVPSDAGNSAPADTNPGMGLKDAEDDSLSPEDSSMMTMGSVEDIVAQFQRTAGAAVLDAGPAGSSTDSSDIAEAAKAFLSKEAMAVFSPAEQQALINEGEGSKAANLDRLQIEGTHYEALDAALAKQDGDDEEGWMD